jgi:peroxiredoxin
MKKTISRLFSVAIIVLATISFSACSKQKFHVNGAITDAKDSILYFENISLKGPVVVDSVKLSSDGTFSFSDDRPHGPEFYRLRINDQIINLAIDSTETVTFKAKYSTMPTDYTVDGSYDCSKIKELALMQIALTNKAMAIEASSELGADAVRDSLRVILNAYKENVKQNYIFKEPNKAYAYFALFQTLGNYLIFDPQNNRDDIKVYAAVATSWDTFYPKCVRGQNLHNIAIEGLKNTRIIQARQAQTIDASKVSESGIIDISLPDNHGRTRTLSSLKGKVVMLDFHVFNTKESPARIMMLRELYNKYAAKGFEIYQVSLDNNEHFWKTSTAALPWISVHDENGIESQKLQMYNITKIPTYFLIDRESNLKSRDDNVKDLDSEIQKLL